MTKANQTPHEPSSLEEAGKLLRQELSRPGIREKWARYLPENFAQNSSEIPSQRAVARAIAASQYQLYGLEVSPSSYKDRVRRAIIGQHLTMDTLELLTDTFDISPESQDKIASIILAVDQQVERDIEHRNRFISPTTSCYDIYLNKDLKPYKMDCSIMLRTVGGRIESIWALNSDDILDIELLEGGTRVWDREHKSWKFLLDYPLEPYESLHLHYLIHIDPLSEQLGLVHLDYGTVRSSCFYRLFFDSVETAPSALEVTRRFAALEDSPFNLLEKKYLLPVYENRASLYLDTLYKEKLIFDIFEEGQDSEGLESL